MPPHAISALLEIMLIGVKIKILWSLFDIVSCAQMDSRRSQVGGIPAIRPQLLGHGLAQYVALTQARITRVPI